MLRPPKTNDPALNRFLEEVASTIQDRVRPEEGWTLSDFASSVSEVISDKRDLIDIVTKYDNIEGLSEEMEAAVARLKTDVQDSMDLLSSVNSKAVQFAEVMAWWDQNYTVVFDAQEALEILQEIHGAMAEHQSLLDQIAAATAAAENLVAEIQATEEAVNAAVEAAKTSEINATNAATRANTSETEAGQSAAAAEASATDAEDAAGRAAVSETNAASSAATAQGHATEAEGHADGARVAAIDAADQAVMEKFAEFLEGAPEMLDTWMEVVTAIQSGDSEIAALTAQLATKISGPYTIAVQAGGYPAAGTPSNQITFVTEVG